MECKLHTIDQLSHLLIKSTICDFPMIKPRKVAPCNSDKFSNWVYTPSCIYVDSVIKNQLHIPLVEFISTLYTHLPSRDCRAKPLDDIFHILFSSAYTS